MEGTNIAKLVASLGFQIEDKQLNSFLKKIQTTVTELKAIREVAASKIQFKIGLDKTELTAAKRQISNIGNTKITLTKLAIGQAGLTEIRRQIQTAMGTKLSLAVNVKDANAQLHAWAKRTNDKFRVNIKAQVSKRALAQSLREATKYATEVVGVLKLKDPKVKVGIDKEHLRTEIKDAIAHIQREIKIKIDLTGHGTVGGNVGGGSRASHASIMGAAGLGAVGGGMEAGRTLVPGLGAMWGVGQLSKISQELVGMDTALKTVGGDETSFQSNSAFLQDMGAEMGKTMRDIMPSYTSILASTKPTLGDEGTQDMFRGIMKYGTVMNIDPEAMKGALRAVGQMFGKNKVQAEEAQGQFAEHMPAGMQLLAQAHGTTTEKLRIDMEKGKLDPTKLLPELGRIMENLVDTNGRYADSLTTSRVAQGRFNYHLEKTIKLFAADGFDRTMFDFWTELTNVMLAAEEHTKGLARGFEILMVPVIATLRLVQKLIAYWPKIAEGLGLTSESAGVLATTIVGLLFPFTRFLTLLSLGTTALDDLTTYLTGGDSALGAWIENLSPENRKRFDDFIAGIKILKDTIVDLFTSGWERLKELIAGFEINPEKQASLEKFAAAIGSMVLEIVKLVGVSLERLIQLAQWLWNSPISNDVIDSFTEFATAVGLLAQALRALLELDMDKLGSLMTTMGQGISKKVFGERLTNMMMEGNAWTKDKLGMTSEADAAYQREHNRQPASVSSANYAGTPPVESSNRPPIVFPIKPNDPALQPQMQGRGPVTVHIGELKLENVQDVESLVNSLMKSKFILDAAPDI